MHSQRELISETFSAYVANGYEGRDSGFISHECPNGNMHITDENVMIEIIDPSGKLMSPGKVGVTCMASSLFMLGI